MRELMRYNNPHGDDKVMDGCSIFGVMDTSGAAIPADVAIRAIDLMRDRDNGLGGGFAVYGLYPEHAEEYAFHVMYASRQGQRDTEGDGVAEDERPDGRRAAEFERVGRQRRVPRARLRRRAPARRP